MLTYFLVFNVQGYANIIRWRVKSYWLAQQLPQKSMTANNGLIAGIKCTGIFIGNKINKIKCLSVKLRK